MFNKLKPMSMATSSENIKKSFQLLYHDAVFYCSCKPSAKTFIRLLFNRDFFLNILIRAGHSRILFVSQLSILFQFLIYKTFVSPKAKLDVPIRFQHAHSVTVGSDVSFCNGSAYIFNNVTIGKKYPLSSSVSSMPSFKGHCIFCVGSVVVGNISIVGNTVFAANSFCSIDTFGDVTLTGNNNVIQGVFYASQKVKSRFFEVYSILDRLRSTLSLAWLPSGHLEN